MDRDRPRKSWRDVDRGRDKSVHRREADEHARRQEESARASATAREHRNALEALFAPKVEEAAPVAMPKTAARIVLAPNPDADPRHAERRRLLARLADAAGPASISRVANDFIAAGFEFPDDQEIYLQLLEHVDEERVRDAIARLTRLLAGELPKRKPVLDQRLRRIEEHAEEPTTRDAASALRRVLQGRPASSAAGGAR